MPGATLDYRSAFDLAPVGLVLSRQRQMLVATSPRPYPRGGPVAPILTSTGCQASLTRWHSQTRSGTSRSSRPSSDR